MKAAWYEKQGPPNDVLTVGEMTDPSPSAGEVRIRIAASGINPGDVKKRQDTFGIGMPYARIIPHSDGAGEVDKVGDGVPGDWLGKRVWCFGAQSYRPFGTAAEYTVVPAAQVALLPADISMEQGACLGIPGITGHRAVHVAGSVENKTVLVQGAAGAVGICAVALARHAGARVIAGVRTPDEEATAREAGANHVLLNDAELAQKVAEVAPQGVDHIVEVAFAANIERDVELLKLGGSIASYASNSDAPIIPFWPMVFKNVRVFFLGSDDFPPEAKAEAARDINGALEAGWQGFTTIDKLSLDDVARAHALVEHPERRGRIVVTI